MRPDMHVSVGTLQTWSGGSPTLAMRSRRSTTRCWTACWWAPWCPANTASCFRWGDASAVNIFGKLCRLASWPAVESARQLAGGSLLAQQGRRCHLGPGFQGYLNFPAKAFGSCKWSLDASSSQGDQAASAQTGTEGSVTHSLQPPPGLLIGSDALRRHAAHAVDVVRRMTAAYH